MTTGHKELGKLYMSSLINRVPNLVRRVSPEGDLRDQAISGVYSECMVAREGHGGISMEDAQVILDEWIKDATNPPIPSWGK